MSWRARWSWRTRAPVVAEPWCPGWALGSRGPHDGLSLWTRQTRFSSGSLGALPSSESWVVIAAAGLSLLALHAAVTAFALQFVLQRVNVKTGARSWESWSTLISTFSFLSFRGWVVPVGVFVALVEAVDGRPWRSRWSRRSRRSRVAESRTTSRLSFLTLVAVYSRTTRSSRHSNFTLDPGRSVRARWSNRSEMSSVSLQPLQALQSQQVPVGSDHQTRLSFLTLQADAGRTRVSSVALRTHRTRETSLTR